MIERAALLDRALTMIQMAGVQGLGHHPQREKQPLVPGRFEVDLHGSAGEVTGDGRLFRFDVAARHLSRLMRDTRNGGT